MVFLYYEYNKGRVYPSDFLNFYVSIIAYFKTVFIIFPSHTEFHFLQKNWTVLIKRVIL